MDRSLKIGILRETKNIPDTRVPLTPSQIVNLQSKFPHVEFLIQSSKIRCFGDEEYLSKGIPVVEDLSSCDILMGVKEVNKAFLIPCKNYLFFAHVAKKQPHNRDLFREILNKKIRLIDYEYLTGDSGKRLVAFGRWAGILGAYQGLRAIGLKTNQFKLRPPQMLKNLSEMKEELKLVKLSAGYKILVTGRGRVSHGVIEILKACNLQFVDSERFLSEHYNVPVVCEVSSKEYYTHKNGNKFDVNHFHQHPEEYVSSFLPYTRLADCLITGHFWDPRSDIFFSKTDMKKRDFKIKVVADITCDIDGSIPCTIKATTADEPFFDFNPDSESEELPFSSPENIAVMSIDNLASELPRDASRDFGEQLIKNVFDDLFSQNQNGMIERATITNNGEITPRFAYLSDYLHTS